MVGLGDRDTDPEVLFDLKKQAVSPVLSRISLSTGLTTAKTSRSFSAVAAQYDIRTPTLMRSPVLSSSPWATMLLTSRCTVEVGSSVACWISPSDISGWAREKASRISVILPSTSNGCCLDEAAASSVAMTRIYLRSHTCSSPMTQLNALDFDRAP